MAKEVRPIPDGYHTVTPYLIVPDAPGAISFLERAFEAALLSRHDGPDGTVMHAEVRIGDSRIMMGQGNDEWPALRSMLHLYVEDVDAVYGTAVEAGARALREPENMFYGDRSGGVEDPWGNQWWIATRIEDVPPDELARRAEAARSADGD